MHGVVVGMMDVKGGSAEVRGCFINVPGFF